jgi:competence protein ComEA
MRNVTIASLLATALTLGLMTATPSIAQTTQPAAKTIAPPTATAPKAAETTKPVDTKAVTRAAPESKTVGVAKAELIDINTATQAQLEPRKGIGPVRAAAIIKGRPYKGKDELVQKHILPQATYDKIKDQIVAKQKS